MKRVEDDLLGAMASCLEVVHEDRLVRCLLISFSAVWMTGEEVHRVRSSAYEVMLLLGMGQSDKKKLNNAGDITDPWGTPAGTPLRGEMLLLKIQAALRPRTYAASQRVMSGFRGGVDDHLEEEGVVN